MVSYFERMPVGLLSIHGGPLAFDLIMNRKCVGAKPIWHR